MKIKITKVPSNRKDLGGILQAGGSNWIPGDVTLINEGGTHSLNPYEGVQVGVDPEGTPNLVEEGEVIWNDYVFSNRIKVPKEACKKLRIGQKKNGFTFADAAKKLLVESKERPNDPISKKGLEANMLILEDVQEEVKKKMEAEQAVEQFNSLPPEQQVAIMNQEGEKALNAVAQEQMAQELQNMPPEQQQAIAQQMAMEQALAQGMPQGQPSPEEQAIMQQQMAQQQMPQSNINPQEALAQAAAMQQQAIAAYGGKLCFGERKFAEGGMIPQDKSMVTEEQNQQSEQPAEQTTKSVDSEMAKYSDEELQEMINEYEEAANGEKKVTKGKLARLRKKAERAERELQRRNSQGENSQEELAGNTQGQRLEPTEELMQAAAQALAQQLMMEGQPQEGMSPEQAMMMQQLMGGQPLMSPEEMAAAELQQQAGQQYAYGGKLYPTGGRLSDYAQYFPSMYYDELAGLLYDKLGLNFRVETSYANENDRQKNAVNAVSKEDFIKAMRANNYDVDAALKSFDFTSSDYVHPQQAALDLVEPSGYTKNLIYSLNGTDNLYKNYDIDPNIYRDAILLVYYDRNPEARNSGLTFSNNPYRTYANVNFHDATSVSGNNGNKMVAESFYANDPAWNQLDEKLKQLKGNELAAALEGTLAYKDFSTYLRNNRNSQYVKDYFTELANRGSKIAKNALAHWDDLTNESFSKIIENLREDAAAPPNSPGNKNNNALGLGHFTPAFAENWTNRYWVKDKDGNYSQVIGGIADADKNKYVAINTNPYQVTVDGNNYNDYYYRLKTDADNSSPINTEDESNYLTVGWKPRTNWMDYALGALPGLTGLGLMLAQGKPDMSGIEAAANAYAANMGAQAPIHLTHGLMKPAIIDPRVTHNTLTASRLGTNRMLRNTGSAPSQAATILANDVNYQHQMGSNDLRDWLANREQEQKAATFNEGVARANATFLNQGDQFNAQMLANAGEKYAQLRYNAEKEKLDQENAWRAGILGNVGSAMTGLYNAYREGQNRNERDLLLASEVFGPTNGLLDYYYGISKVDPKTGKVVRGRNSGQYYRMNPNTGEPEFSNKPFLATPSYTAAKGGKLRRKSKKRKGFTF